MMKYRNVAIVEPHYDDAWINLGGYILKHPEIKFKILSVSYDSFNDQYETRKLSKILPNVITKALKYKGLHWNLIGRVKEETYLPRFLKLNKLKSLSELATKIQKECANEDLVLMPLGTIHPQHIVVSKVKLDLPTKCYIEWPYCYEKKGYFDNYMNRAEIIDISDVIEKKIKIFSQVYKTQLDLLEMTPKTGVLLAKNNNEIISSKS